LRSLPSFDSPGSVSGGGGETDSAAGVSFLKTVVAFWDQEVMRQREEGTEEGLEEALEAGDVAKEALRDYRATHFASTSTLPLFLPPSSTPAGKKSVSYASAEESRNRHNRDLSNPYEIDCQTKKGDWLDNLAPPAFKKAIETLKQLEDISNQDLSDMTVEDKLKRSRSRQVLYNRRLKLFKKASEARRLSLAGGSSCIDP
jgi:hypothetical protein